MVSLNSPCSAVTPWLLLPLSTNKTMLNGAWTQSACYKADDSPRSISIRVISNRPHGLLSVIFRKTQNSYQFRKTLYLAKKEDPAAEFYADIY
jgi:hypothetical protein